MQPVQVDEPTVAETITILHGLQKRYEDYHHVKYTDEAINAAKTYPIVTFKIAFTR